MSNKVLYSCLTFFLFKAFSPLYACEVEQVLKRKRELSLIEQNKSKYLAIEPVTHSPQEKTSILSLPSDNVCQIISYLPLANAISTERVCRKFSNYLSNSKQYLALIEKWIDSKELITEKYRIVFYKLKNSCPEFQVYLADFQLKYYPLKLKGEKLPLTHYREKFIDLEIPSLKTSFNEVYRNYNLNTSNKNSSCERSEYTQRSEWGEIITGKMDTQAQYASIMLFLTKKNYSLKLLNEAEVAASFMEITGKSPRPVNFQVTRSKLEDILKNNEIESSTEAKIYFIKAEMDRLGQGVPSPDFVSARDLYVRVLDNSATPLPFKSLAQFGMAEMDRLGQGIPSPDFVSARSYYKQIIGNLSSLPSFSLKALLWIARMDLLGKGIIKPHPKSARSYYKQIINNPLTPFSLKAACIVEKSLPAASVVRLLTESENVP